MARRQVSFQPTSEIALTAAASKTVMRVSASSSVGIVVLEYGVFFDGVSAVAEPVIVRLVRLSSDGTMTGLTGNLTGLIQGETVQASGAFNATVEPGLGAQLELKEIHPQSGYEKAYGFNTETYVPPSGRIGLVIMAPANVNCIPYMKIEE